MDQSSLSNHHDETTVHTSTARRNLYKDLRRRGSLGILCLVVLNVALLGIQSYLVFHPDGKSYHVAIASVVRNSIRGAESSLSASSTIREAEVPEALGRILVSTMETKTVHNQPKTTTPIPSGGTTSNANIDAHPNNLGEYNLPSYHYTTPKPVDDPTGKHRQYFLKDETTTTSMNAPDSDSDYGTETTPTPSDPKLAWLASFPNSGTSFTMGMVARATNKTFATNYGIEANFGSREVPSLPIYPNHPEGPYMPDPTTSFHHRELPYGNYVLTKTHCGGYCVNCRPTTYAYGYSTSTSTTEDSDSSSKLELQSPAIAIPAVAFLNDCASGFAVDHEGRDVDVSYPPERVSRVVHLIRNPFHNAIARFHLERKHHDDANTTSDQEWLTNHPDNHEGISKFCAEQNDLRWDLETTFFESDYFFRTGSGDKNETQKHTERQKLNQRRSPTEPGVPNPEEFEAWRELASNVPCRGDFFRYVQWHTLLHQSLDYLPYRLPVMTLYYEGFQPPTYEATTHAVLDFLDLQPSEGGDGKVIWSEFHSRDDYDEFFRDEQKEVIREFLQTLSSFRVWGEIEHYFR